MIVPLVFRILDLFEPFEPPSSFSPSFPCFSSFTSSSFACLSFRDVASQVPYTLSMDFVEESANFCKALAAAITEHEAAYGHFDVAHGHEWLLEKER